MNGGEVVAELVEGGFEVLQSREFRAYEPKADEPVPISGVCICR